MQGPAPVRSAPDLISRKRAPLSGAQHTATTTAARLFRGSATGGARRVPRGALILFFLHPTFMDNPRYHAEVVTRFQDLRQVIGVDVHAHTDPSGGTALVELTCWNDRQDTDLYSAGVLSPAKARELGGHLLRAADEADRFGRATNRSAFPSSPVPALDDPKPALAFTDGESCVAILRDGDADPGHEIRISFNLRGPMPRGRWAGVLEIPAAGFRALKALVDQAEGSLRAADEEG
jgi:hypothetical protein